MTLCAEPEPSIGAQFRCYFSAIAGRCLGGQLTCRPPSTRDDYLRSHMCRGKAHLAVARLQALVIMYAGPPFAVEAF